LCDQSEYSHGEPVNVGTITTDEVHVAVLESEEKLSVPTESVEFGDHEGGFQPATFTERFGQLRTVVVFTGLDLRELSDHRSPLAVDVTTDGLVLGLQTKT
jgi:hypothetical protein